MPEAAGFGSIVSIEPVAGTKVFKSTPGGFATNVCDPTGGFTFTQQTKDNFGKINLKRGHRVIEFVLKYYF